MADQRVMIAGGGIGGLSLALTLNQIGVDCIVFESVENLRPLGVGINLQPNAVRELFDLGLTSDDLDAFGVPAKEWALVGLNGQEIYSEPRGTLAGYDWPQYAVHRGSFHMALYQRLLERAGPDAVRLGSRATGYEINPDGSVSVLLQTGSGKTRETGTLLIGADGIHSSIRSQMHPCQPPIHWGGSVMWRGTTQAKPVRTGSSFVGLGTHKHRMVMYPISHPDPNTGLAQVNWIAEVTYEDPSAHQTTGWFRQVETNDFAHHFDDWTYDWLDVPALIRGAEVTYENPMIDREPVETWIHGTVALLGDAAHAMYPTGSNGASQAIMDARILGSMLLEHGLSNEALTAYDAALCGPISDLVLRNRNAGPFGLLKIVNDRCSGDFDDIDNVISPSERSEFMAKYKAAAGFARDALNRAKPTIAPGARLKN
ncbi:flavin-dependent oxidoreductase [Ruegeria arenilitoris]|uniref:flavin-dependent oxidoreductase n=1 Tax=Ruegeria arenilitoris TaxID=1173585 RepID=UPI00147A8033|nr:flavin-dependent oxidoreductase [Ruegeria arenilitoris]